jgi:hypothetical protein
MKIVKLITDMLKKENEVIWTTEDKASFECINKMIGETPMLAILDYMKEFLIFSFTFEHTIAVMLLQKNGEGFE